MSVSKLKDYFETAKNTVYDLATSAANKIREQDIPTRVSQVYQDVTTTCLAWVNSKKEEPQEALEENWQVIQDPNVKKNK